MKKLLIAAVGMIVMAIGQSVFAAEILGKVADSQGTPITHVAVAVRDSAGRTVGSMFTNDNGVFEFKDLIPGDYRIQLRPLTGGVLGRIVPVHLLATGMTFIWRIYVNRPALAYAPLPPRRSLG